ncbi:MAG: CapA family protein [Myxococcales bacterium]|nr:CapA family protein [Myxococcales bacterium]
MRASRTMRPWLWAMCALVLLSCDRRERDTQLHTIAFAGDTILGRSVNTLVERHGVDWPLREVRESLAGADLTVVNLECVIAAGGAHAGLQRGARAYLRGRPELVGTLAGAGIDIASLANNHGGDYGPDAVLESIRWLSEAGVSPLGVGANADAATAPVYRQLGGTTVGFVGVQTMVRSSRATGKRAGTNHVGARNADEFVAEVKRQVKRARRHADLVLLVIHWGPNNRERPSEHHRTLARRFVREAGIDGLLGSSAHLLQGIEVIDGRPIIYDAGNLVLDWRATRPWTHRSAIFVLHANNHGIARVEVKPTTLFLGHTRMATEKEGAKILERLDMLSRELGTTLAIEGDRASLELVRPQPPPLAPDPYRPPAEAPPAPRMPDWSSYQPAVVVERLPASATPLRVRFEQGFELLGYELPREIDRKLGVNVATYWRASESPSRSYRIFLELHRVLPDGGTKRALRGQEHQPADWMYPTTRWQPGEIVRDFFHIRTPAGLKKPTTYEVIVGLLGGRRRLKVLDAAQHDGKHAVSLGKVTRR